MLIELKQDCISFDLYKSIISHTLVYALGGKAHIDSVTKIACQMALNNEKSVFSDIFEDNPLHKLSMIVSVAFLRNRFMSSSSLASMNTDFDFAKLIKASLGLNE